LTLGTLSRWPGLFPPSFSSVANALPGNARGISVALIFNRRWVQIRGDFPGFLKYFSGQSDIGEYRGNIPLELDEQCKLFITVL